MHKKNKNTKKGMIVKKYTKEKIYNIKGLEKANGKLQEVRNYNGKFGGFFNNGQFRWIRFEKKVKSPKKISCPCKCNTTNCKCRCPNNTCICNIKGGAVGKKSIDLKKAVKLLRNYYSEKYN